VKAEADTDYDRSLDDDESREGDDSLNYDRMLGRFLDMLIQAQSRTAWKSSMPGRSLYGAAH
jgi:hypothetical protein